MRKPDDGIYEILIERLKEEGILSEEAVFVDDEEVNLEGARRFGVKGILFDGVRGLRVKLEELGVGV